MATATTTPASSTSDAPAPLGWQPALQARLGSLRPGGVSMTRRMLEGAEVREGSRVVDVAPGYGATGAMLNDTNLHGYAAVCADDAYASAVRARIDGPGRAAVVAAPDATGLPDSESTAVIGEGLLSAVDDAAACAILEEAGRLLRPGGLVAFHELCALPDPWTESAAATELGELGIHLRDERAWRRLIEDARLDVVGVMRGALEIPSAGDVLRDAGRRNMRRVLPALVIPGGTSHLLRRTAYLLDRHRAHVDAVVVVARRPVLAQA